MPESHRVPDGENLPEPVEPHTGEEPASTGLPRRTNRTYVAQEEYVASAVARRSPERLEKARQLAITCARIADDNRGRDILVLDLRPGSPLVDFFVIVSTGSRRQSTAIASEIDAEMKRLGEVKLGREGAEEGRWVLIDYGDFVVHVFAEDARGYYSLENIWGDSARVDWVDPNRPKPRVAAQTEPVTMNDEDEVE